MVRLDVWGVRDQTGSRDRFVDTDTGLTHTVTHTHTHTHLLKHTHTVDLRSGGEMTFAL